MKLKKKKDKAYYDADHKMRGAKKVRAKIMWKLCEKLFWCNDSAKLWLQCESGFFNGPHNTEPVHSSSQK